VSFEVTLSNVMGKQNRNMLFSSCFYGFCASRGLEWACSVFVRDSRRALEGPSRFVLLMTIELYRHCWKHPEERMLFPCQMLLSFILEQGQRKRFTPTCVWVFYWYLSAELLTQGWGGLCVSVIMWERI